MSAPIRAILEEHICGANKGGAGEIHIYALDNLEDEIQKVIGNILEARENTIKQRNKCAESEREKLLETKEGIIVQLEDEIRILKTRNKIQNEAIGRLTNEVGRCKKETKNHTANQELVEYMEEEIGFLRTLALANSKHGEQE
jgi:predicted RNase H-like nuclease (RuvC/YqgF family)